MNVNRHSMTIKFTKLDFESSYKVKLSSIEWLQTGHTNHIYKLNLKDSRTLISRISVTRPLEALEYEAKFHEFLTENGVYCPKIIGNKYVEMVFNEQTGNQFPSILMEFIEGQHPNSLNDLRIAGNELAKLHQLEIPSFSRECASFSLKIFKTLFLPDVFYDYITPNLLKNILWMVESDINEYDVTICHGDLFRINTLMNDQKAYFIDFESTGKNNFLLDLGKALFGMVTPRVIDIDSKSAHSFLDGYIGRKPLSMYQIELLPFIAALAGIQVAYWRYNYWQKNPNHSDITEHLWKDALMTSLSWVQFSFKE
ncbi:hypothetical protein PTI45_04622 [Paenibacillus nuruki]|uniref:Aminoglycoside phosphotransferase domain-containing protein n=1 Tax=Paenibacillus nuruki TaxID=1886670 RepID=A0A1E3KX34_9BACL|nr:phosphotransferase [Paenibacillus nuruki]ODP26036.1 hypothetical protein PTI45_04622 [Paenibacillus nuruki]